jgi:hypothetical protein
MYSSLRRVLNFWRLRSYDEDEFTIEYYKPIFGGVVVTRVTVNDFIDPIDMLWGAAR